MPDITTDTSNLVINDGATYNVKNNATVDGSELINGNLYAYNDGATIKNFTVTGGTLMLRGAANKVDTIVLSGGKLLVQRGGSAVNVDVFAGASIENELVGWGGGYISAVRISGGNVYINSNGECHDVTLNAGTLDIRAGASVVDGINYLGGTLTLADGITIHNLTASKGVVFKNGTTVSGLTMNVGWADVSSGGAVKGGTLNTANGTVIRNGGVVENVTLTAGQLQVQSGGTLSEATITAGTLHISTGAVVNKTTYNGGTINIGNGVTIGETTYTGGTLNIGTDVTFNGLTANKGVTLKNGTTVNNVTMNVGWLDVSSGCAVNGGTLNTANGTVIRDGGVVENVTLTAGQLQVQNGGTLSGTTVSSGTLNVSSAAIVKDITYDGGTLNIADGATVSGFTANKAISLKNGTTVSGLTMNVGWLDVSSGGVVNGGTLNTANGTVIRSGGVVRDVELMGGEIQVKDGGTLSEATITAGTLNVSSAAVATSLTMLGGRTNAQGSDALVSGAVVSGGATWIGNGGILQDTDVFGGTVIVRHVAGWSSTSDITTATAEDVRIKNGGTVQLESGGILQAGKLADGANLTIYKGGKAALTSADAGAVIDISFWDVNSGHGNTDAIITDWGTFSADAKINIYSLENGYSYKIADTANADATLTLANTSWGLYDTVEVKAGDIKANAFTSKSYDFSDGTTLTLGSVTVTTKTGDASALTSDDAITGGRAVKWDSATGVTSGNIFLAGDMTSGQAWVEFDGYEGGANTTLYGAQGNSFATGTVNIYAKSGSLRNLAAGADKGGTVAAVNLTVAGAELDGTGYAGGFGNVTGAVATRITNGAFAKDFYAGALANKLEETTSVDDVAMTIDGGTFSGSIYGASAVKTDATKGNGTRHTAGDVTLTITGGESTKGYQTCIFAGGYATGDATGTVYTVDSVTATISGGNWGMAAGGRGVFGGIMASGVEAQVIGDVNITVSGNATMGNVYGGGWAQKTGAKSIVGDVNINIEGGTITNVFGGGSHSTSGGTTETGDVTITVSGGDITGAIYARGQLDGDITGAANVIFTGATDFGCDVFGYSYVGGAASDAALSFTGYTGEFSGNIGGFNGITFDGATAMELTTATADVSNGAWEFDLTDRADTLAGTSLLTWSGASFENDTIKVTFADDTQAQGGWNIATVAEAFSGTTFDVKVGDSEIATGLAYNQQIASGDYAGWGFELESGVLKFKNLASA